MMINIVSSEFYKIFRSKILYAISIVLLIMNSIACIGSIVVKTSNSFSPEIKSQMQGTGVSSYQSSFGGDIIFYLIIIFIAQRNYFFPTFYQFITISFYSCHFTFTHPLLPQLFQYHLLYYQVLNQLNSIYLLKA